jgi:hypothetical protein
VPDKLEALGILVLLLPGFLCAYIVQQLAVRRSQTELEKVIEGPILSFVLYMLVLPFGHYQLPVSWVTTPGQIGITVHWKALLALGGLAIALALIYAANINHDWVLRFCRWINLTERTSRNTIWNDAFQDIQNRYLAVGLADGRSVVGYLRYYSDDPQEASLFLEDAAWLEEKTKSLLMAQVFC